jgi:Cof subfamily protein (haloacid dehalogenase superfamily)
VPTLQYKLLALDIDGTLLNECKEILATNIEALQLFQASGGHVILVSGRNPRSTLWHAELLELKTPYVAFNGAIIGTGEHILTSHFFSTNTVLQFLTICKEEAVYCHVYTVKAMFYDTPTRWNANWSRVNLARIEGKPVNSLWENKVETYCPSVRVKDLRSTVYDRHLEIAKMAVLSDNPLEAIENRLKCIKGLTITSSQPGNLEIAPHGVSKGSALLQVVRMLQAEPKDIMVIGDNFNDLSMFQVAELSVAMGNAPEKVRSSAQVVTETNDHAGVAQAIRSWAFGEMDVQA